jgi:exodeoxyribonuclease VII small subunit
MGKKMPEVGTEPAQQQPETFEAALGELEEIVQRMESAEVPLDESLRLYARGTFLISHCQQRLDTAEKQIEQLTRGKDGRLLAGRAPAE